MKCVVMKEGERGKGSRLARQGPFKLLGVMAKFGESCLLKRLLV